MKTLQDYLNDYRETLSNKIFKITLSDGSCFVVSFNDSNFPHLLGLSHCSEDKKRKKNYAGNKAISAIDDGSLTLEVLKTKNEKAFNRYVLSKIDSFERLLCLFPDKPHSLEAVKFDKTRVIKILDRNIEGVRLIIYDKNNPRIKDEIWFCEESNSLNTILYPQSIRKNTDQTNDYLDMQDKYQIVNVEAL